MAKTLKLNNGREIPIIGLGTYKGSSKEISQAVQDAIDAGYRHFDCAWFYGNEEAIGEGLWKKINDGVVQREDLFITSKLWNNFHEEEKVVPMLKETLKSLKMDYIDLYLVHWPFGFKGNDPWPVGKGASAYSDTDYLETWKGMETCVDLGVAKSIGISNFNSEQIDRLLANCRIKPVVNQVEVNPNINQKKLIQFCKKRDIVITGYCPLSRTDESGRGNPAPTILDPKVIEMAKKHNKTPAQIVLNYLVSLGITLVPKSVTKARIIQNIDIFDFQLSPEDTAYLDSCDKDQIQWSAYNEPQGTEEISSIISRALIK